MIIDTKKKYMTVDGKDVRVLCTDFKNVTHKIVCAVKISEDREELVYVAKDGYSYIDEDGWEYDSPLQFLVECDDPWKELEVDAKILVNGKPRHYAGEYINGFVYYFIGGMSSFTIDPYADTSVARARKSDCEIV